MSFITTVERFVLCDALDYHYGDVESACVENERHDLMVTYIPCKRCGRLKPLSIRPQDEVEYALHDSPFYHDR